MNIEKNLIRGEIVKRYNSLLMDVRLADGKIVSAFCSSLKIGNICLSGNCVYLKEQPRLRIVQYEIEFIGTKEGLILVNPTYKRRLFLEAFERGLIAELQDFSACRELSSSDALSYADFELTNKNHEKCVVFIENVYGKVGGYSAFPEGINFFEIEMFENLARLRKKGYRTIVFMIVPREDCAEAKFSWVLDPIAAAKIFDEAKNGLEFICYGCNVGTNNVTINRSMNILY